MLDKKYNHQETEKKWQNYWQNEKIFAFKNDLEKEQTFVIDTPPPTVSGLLHMGHVFSYTQADFIARFQRMNGKDVFYPMGFDDNGLPTERLVEKIIGKKASVYEKENGSGSFIKKCQEEVDKAEEEFEALFNSIALSVDWSQKYQTISPNSQKLSQSSFVDLYKKGLIYQDFRPVIWDCVDQTALSQADLEDSQVKSLANFIEFESEDGDKIEIMTTRPELLPACVALLLNPEHDYAKKIGATKEGKTDKFAYSAVFGVKVPIIIDNDVKIDKDPQSNVTGAVMCCSYGDENDVKWVQKYGLVSRVMINDYGKICDLIKSEIEEDTYFLSSVSGVVFNRENTKNLENFIKIYNENLASKKIKQAREEIIKFLEENGCLTRDSKEITQVKKIAERSKTEIEYLEKKQWFIKVLPFKEELKKQIEKCAWYPEFMKVRALQWCENLNSDWCVSRQRFFGVPIPAWEALPKFQKILKPDLNGIVECENGEITIVDTQLYNDAINNARDKNCDRIVADFHDLPIDPKNFEDEKNIDKIFKIFERNGFAVNKEESKKEKLIITKKDNNEYFFYPETNILDTWATSSISPQLSSGLVSSEMLDSLLENNAISQEEAEKLKQRHEKLFPADMRPQAHEIIRTWAFYTITKAFLHNLDKNQTPQNQDRHIGLPLQNQSTQAKQNQSTQDNSIPWKNLMISGWCLAADKTKMSKSKGNVVTPTKLIEEKGSDIVRYWTSTSSLGADTAYSEDIFKIGQKLTTKLFNAAKFSSMNFDLIQDLSEENSSEKITEVSDLWILSKLNKIINSATKSLEKFEYSKARETIEDFFFSDFCDNYLEIIKVRSYGLKAQKLEGISLTKDEEISIINKQISAILTLKITLNKLLKLFSPFIPHICEELYSQIFEEEFALKKSINSRGNWPKTNKIFENENHEKIGEEFLKIIFHVRKYKSDNNLSMKTPIQLLEISSPLDLNSIKEDIQNVCGAIEISLGQKDVFGVNIK